MSYQPQAVPKDSSVTAAKIDATLKPSGSAAAGTEALRALGTTGSTAAAGNDSRITGAEQTSNKGAANGYAGLNASSAVPVANLGTGTPAAGKYVDGGTGAWTTLPSAGALTIQSLTGAGTATIDTVVKADATTAAFTVTLPAAAGNSGRRIIVKKMNSNGNAVTVDGNASETIDGSTTYVISIQYETVEMVSDGTNWVIV